MVARRPKVRPRLEDVAPISAQPIARAPRQEHRGGAEVGIMQARAGGHLGVESSRVAAPRREGEIVEVKGADGAPPYLVRWSDGHEALTCPGADAHVVSG